MALIRINRQPSAKDLRVFATLWLVFVGVLGWWAQQRGSANLANVLWAVAGLVGVLGWVAPTTVRYVYIGSIYLTFPIGWVVSHIVLTVLYFLVITPIGLIMRALGRDPLQRRFDRKATTYWQEKEPARPPTSYFKQY
jgi:hypothetical protein